MKNKSRHSTRKPHSRRCRCNQNKIYPREPLTSDADASLSDCSFEEIFIKKRRKRRHRGKRKVANVLSKKEDFKFSNKERRDLANDIEYLKKLKNIYENLNQNHEQPKIPTIRSKEKIPFTIEKSTSIQPESSIGMG